MGGAGDSARVFGGAVRAGAVSERGRSRSRSRRCCARLAVRVGHDLLQRRGVRRRGVVGAGAICRVGGELVTVEAGLGAQVGCVGGFVCLARGAGLSPLLVGWPAEVGDVLMRPVVVRPVVPEPGIALGLLEALAGLLGPAAAGPGELGVEPAAAGLEVDLWRRPPAQRANGGGAVPPDGHGGAAQTARQGHALGPLAASQRDPLAGAPSARSFRSEALRGGAGAEAPVARACARAAW